MSSVVRRRRRRRFPKAKGQAGHEVMGQWRYFDRAAGDVERVEIGVGKFVFKHQPPMPGQHNIDPGEGLHARAMHLVFLVKEAVDLRFDMRNRKAEPDAGIRREVPEKILTPRAGKPAINNIAERVVEPVRKTELLDRVVESFVRVHAHALAASGDMHRVASVRIHFHVEKFRPKTPMRIERGKPKRPRAIVGRSFEIAPFEGDIVEGEIGSARLMQIEIAILGQGDPGEDGEFPSPEPKRAARSQLGD